MSDIEIPDDIRRAANAAFIEMDDTVFEWDDSGGIKGPGSMQPGVEAIIARAILAERERCAQVAAAHPKVIPTWSRGSGPPGFGAERFPTQSEIAHAIRNPLPAAHKPDNDEDGFKRVPVEGIVR